MDAAQPATAPGGQSPPSPAAVPPRNADAALGVADGQERHSGLHGQAANDGILNSAQALFRELGQLASDHIELALLETQRAGKSAVNMIVYAIGAALLLVTSWLGMMAAIVVGFVAMGLHPGWSLLIAVGFNLAGVFGLYLMIRSNSANLRFPATVRSLKTDIALIKSAVST